MNLIRVLHLKNSADGMKHGNKNMKWDVLFSALERPSVINRCSQENKVCAEMPALVCQLLSIIPLHPVVDGFNSSDQQLQNYLLDIFLCREEWSLPCQPWSGWEGMRCTLSLPEAQEVQTMGKWSESCSALAHHRGLLESTESLGVSDEHVKEIQSCPCLMFPIFILFSFCDI